MEAAVPAFLALNSSRILVPNLNLLRGRRKSPFCLCPDSRKLKNSNKSADRKRPYKTHPKKCLPALVAASCGLRGCNLSAIPGTISTMKTRASEASFFPFLALLSRVRKWRKYDNTDSQSRFAVSGLVQMGQSWLCGDGSPNRDGVCSTAVGLGRVIRRHVRNTRTSMQSWRPEPTAPPL